MGIFTYIIGSIQIIRKIRTVKIFVVTMLSHRQGYYNGYIAKIHEFLRFLYLRRFYSSITM